MSASRVAVTPDVVPSRAPALEWVAVDSELVVWQPEREELHRLDPIASLVFQLCDGVTPLRVTVADLAATFQQPYERIEADVHGLLSALVRDGLVLLG